MTRTNLAPAPTDITPAFSAALLERLVSVLETLADSEPVDPELRAYPPAQAARLLGKTENWVTEQIQLGAIPYTRVGKSPRMTPAHIRWVLENGEVMPHKYSPRPLAA